MKKIKFMLLATVLCIYPISLASDTESSTSDTEKKYSAPAPCLLERNDKWVFHLRKIEHIYLFSSGGCVIHMDAHLGTKGEYEFGTDDCKEIKQQYKICLQYLYKSDLLKSNLSS